MASFSLSNFEDTLDPDILDQGRDFLQSGGLRNLENEGDGFWVADFDLDGNPATITLNVNRGRIGFAECSCAAFDEDTWEEEPCLHLVAMLYAVGTAQSAEKSKTKKTEAGKNKTAAKGTKKIPARKSDPAEALLAELEPKEIYEFVRHLITKNKEFKSQFLLHFSERSGGGDQKFEEMVGQAIAAVKGRRKYLKGADGAKIASALTPLYKQAANGEAKGFFREAFLICRTFLRHFPDVLVAMETPSSKLETLFANTLDLISLIIKNPDAPFEFRDEVFEVLLKEYEAVEKTYTGPIKDSIFQRLKESARVTKRQGEVAALLETLVQQYKSMGKKSQWSSDYHAEILAIRRLIDFYDNEIKSPEKALATLETHKDNVDFYLNLIDRKIAAGDTETAIRYIEDCKKNSRKYQSHWSPWQLEKRLNELLLGVYQKQGDSGAIGTLAGRLFVESQHQNFVYYDLEKSVTDPKKWTARVEKYLKETRPGQFRPAVMSNAFFEILIREERWTQLRDELSVVSNLMTWEHYGDPVRARFPDVYLQKMRKNIENELRAAFSAHLSIALNLMNIMARTEGGAPVVREMLAQFRQMYASRRELMRALDKVRVP